MWIYWPTPLALYVLTGEWPALRPALPQSAVYVSAVFMAKSSWLRNRLSKENIVKIKVKTKLISAKSKFMFSFIETFTLSL